MVTICWAAKGGSGTTVVAAALALSSPRPSLLVDLDGDLPGALGLPVPDRPGAADWLASDAPTTQLAALQVDIAPGIALLPWSSATTIASRASTTDLRWREFADWLATEDAAGVAITVDAGTGSPPSALRDAAARSLLVTRACYLSILRASRLPDRPSGVVLVDEPWRHYRRTDVEGYLGAPVVASVPIDPQVARAVDAGLLLSRLPRSIGHGLRRAGTT